jgi:ATP-dependent RNA helicase DeaD
MDPRRESYVLSHGVHIVVGTPGRLCDHLERGALDLSKVEAVVLDEADEMLDMGFREDLERLLEAAPKTRRTLLFSATIPKPIAMMAKRYQKDALAVATAAPGDRHRDIEYHAIPIAPRERDLAVVNLLRYHNPPGALVFCATRDGVTHLTANLNERGFAVVALSGELSQRERNQALGALRDGRARVCVATDVAARGLDLPDLGLVIHADPPQNAQVLVHRSGRTGRAGKHGTAIIIVGDNARRYAERMFATANINISWRLAPTADEIRAKDQAALVTELTELAANPNEDDRAVATTLLAERSAVDLVAALVRLRRDAHPAPEELTIPMSMRPRGAAGDRGHDARDRPRPAPRAAATTEDRPRPAPRAAAATEDRPRPAPRAKAEAHDERPRPAPRAKVDERAADGAGPSAWFAINVGRTKNADPKWLVPLLCRRGDITKRAIGRIEILTRETRVEIAADQAAHFAAAVRRPDDKDPSIHIEPLDR